MKKRSPLYSLDSKIDFGSRHDGELVEDVIISDEKYIWWCLQNVNYFNLDAEAMSFLKHMGDAYHFLVYGQKHKDLKRCRCGEMPRVFKVEPDRESGVGMGFMEYMVQCHCGMGTVACIKIKEAINIWNGEKNVR